MIGKDFRVEHPYHIRQHDFGLGRHTLVERFFPHITIDHVFLLERLEVRGTLILRFQGIITILPGKAIRYPPVIGTLCLIVHGLEIKRHTTGTGIILQEIIRPRIMEQLRQKLFPPTAYQTPPRNSPLNTTGRLFTSPTIAFKEL